jgi:hypothetical protein
VQYVGRKNTKGAESFFESVSISFFEETKKTLDKYANKAKITGLFVGKRFFCV